VLERVEREEEVCEQVGSVWEDRGGAREGIGWRIRALVMREDAPTVTTSSVAAGSGCIGPGGLTGQ
jgi:hypothetical protein